MNLTLKGHSGCRLEFISSSNKTVIRKTSSNELYNERLKKQCSKQDNFSHNTIKKPQVLNSGYQNGLFYFDMEYIPGQPLNQFIRQNTIDKILHKIDSILEFIIGNLRNSTIADCEKKIKQKLNSIELNYSVEKPSVNKINSQVPIGYCHGDLTFENIIVHNDTIYLIDFLDSYLDSPLIDLSKILQDLYLNWSNRNYKVHALDLVRNQLIIQRIQNVIEECRINPSALELQRKMTLLRILPYTDNLKVQLKIIENLKK